MPATSWILLSFIVGSAAGTAGTPLAFLLCAMVTCAIAVRLKPAGTLAVSAAAILATGAAARATAATWSDAHCRATLMRSRSVEFVADFDLHPGDAGPAALRTPARDCETVGLVHARISVRGGTWYRTFTHAEPGDRGVRLAADSGAQPLVETSLRPSLRADGVRRVDSIFTGDAPMARALLLADMHLIDASMRQRWARSGLVHLLSVSGVHVAIIAAALLMLGTAARLSQRHATVLALGMTTAYVLILGLPPPAVRAGVMFGSLLLARLRQRPASEWSVLTLGALLPTVVDPAAPLDLGWQLSVLGVVSLAASGRLAKRLKWHGHGWLHGLRRDVLTSVVASAASAPLIGWYFGTISLIAPLANLVAAPLVTLLQPTLFLALACAPSLPVARFVAGAAHPMLTLLDGVAATAAAPVWAAITIAPTLEQSLLAGAVGVALLVAMVQRHPATPLLVAGVSAGMLAWSELLPSRSTGQLELHLLDVGQGDAIALRTPHGHWIIIDAGGGAPGPDKGRRVVLPYIRARGGPVDAFILSHPHLDHVGGAPALIGATHPTEYFDAAYAGATDAYRASLESAAVHGVHWQRVRPGDLAVIDGVRLRFLAPDSSWTAALHDANLASTIVRVEFGDVAMLFVGDAERAEEEWLLEHTAAELLRADVLKVGHHGSRTSSSAAFLDAVAPRLALVSVGRGNTYGLPSPAIMQDYENRRITLLRTDVVGTTVVSTDGHHITVLTAADRWNLPSSVSADGAERISSPR